MRHKIAFSGYAGSGKTTLAQFLVEEYGFTKVSFADGVRQCFRDVFEPKLGRPLNKALDRMLLQYIGKNGREFFNFDSQNLDFEHLYVTNNKLPEEVSTPMFNDMDTWFLQKCDELGYAHNDPTPDFWIRLAAKNAQNADKVVFDDLRYVNEFTKLKSEGFTIILLECGQKLASQRLMTRDGGFDPDMWNHPSEQEFKTFEPDFIINVHRPLEEVKQDLVLFAHA